MTKRDEPINSNILSKLDPGKKYLLTYKTGREQEVLIIKNDSSRIYGYTIEKGEKSEMVKFAFNWTYEDLALTIDKISEKRFSVVCTSLCVAVPVLIIYIIFKNAEPYSFL
jgi:hypothetical protein